MKRMHLQHDDRRPYMAGKEAGGPSGSVVDYLGAAMSAATLEARNLSRVVRDKVLVSDVCVQVQPGQVMAVVGPSGAGKSSFLRLLNRLDEPTGGTVLLNGQDYRAIAAQELRRRVGMVMQTAYL